MHVHTLGGFQKAIQTNEINKRCFKFATSRCTLRIQNAFLQLETLITLLSVKQYMLKHNSFERFCLQDIPHIIQDDA